MKTHIEDNIPPFFHNNAGGHPQYFAYLKQASHKNKTNLRSPINIQISHDEYVPKHARSFHQKAASYFHTYKNNPHSNNPNSNPTNTSTIYTLSFDDPAIMVTPSSIPIIKFDERKIRRVRQNASYKKRCLYLQNQIFHRENKLQLTKNTTKERNQNKSKTTNNVHAKEQLGKACLGSRNNSLNFNSSLNSKPPEREKNQDKEIYPASNIVSCNHSTNKINKNNLATISLSLDAPIKKKSTKKPILLNITNNPPIETNYFYPSKKTISNQNNLDLTVVPAVCGNITTTEHKLQNDDSKTNLRALKERRFYTPFEFRTNKQNHQNRSRDNTAIPNTNTVFRTAANPIVFPPPIPDLNNLKSESIQTESEMRTKRSKSIQQNPVKGEDKKHELNSMPKYFQIKAYMNNPKIPQDSEESNESSLQSFPFTNMDFGNKLKKGQIRGKKGKLKLFYPTLDHSSNNISPIPLANSKIAERVLFSQSVDEELAILGKYSKNQSPVLGNLGRAGTLGNDSLPLPNSRIKIDKRIYNKIKSGINEKINLKYRNEYNNLLPKNNGIRTKSSLLTNNFEMNSTNYVFPVKQTGIEKNSEKSVKNVLGFQYSEENFEPDLENNYSFEDSQRKRRQLENKFRKHTSIMKIQSAQKKNEIVNAGKNVIVSLNLPSIGKEFSQTNWYGDQNYNDEDDDLPIIYQNLKRYEKDSEEDVDFSYY